MNISNLYNLTFHLLKSYFSPLEIILNSFVVSSTFLPEFYTIIYILSVHIFQGSKSDKQKSSCFYYVTAFFWQLAPTCTSVNVAMETPIQEQLDLRISSPAICDKTNTEIKVVPALQMAVRQVCQTTLEVGLEREECCLHK